MLYKIKNDVCNYNIEIRSRSKNDVTRHLSSSKKRWRLIRDLQTVVTLIR